MPDDRNRFIIAVGARTDRSVRTSLERVRSEIDSTQNSIKEQQRQQRILREEFRQYGAEGRDGASDVRREMLRGTEAIEEQRRELDRLTSEGRELNTTLRGTENNLGNVRDNLTKIGVGAVAIAASVGAAVGVVGGAAQEGSRIRAVADRAGIDTDQVQRLTAELTYAGVENPEQAIEEFKEIAVRATEAARKEGEGFEGFQSLGFDTRAIQEFQKLAPEEQFRTLATELANVTNENERFFIAEQVLGGSLAEQVRGLIALDGAQQQLNQTRAGNVPIFSEEQIASLGELRSDLFEAQAGVEVLRGSIATSLSPAVDGLGVGLQGLTGFLTDFADEHQTTTGIISGGLLAVGAFLGIITLIGGVLPFVKAGLNAVRIAQLFQGGTAKSGALASLRLGGALGLQAIASGIAATAAQGLGAAMTFALGPIGLIIIGIGLAVAAGIFLYKNWDQVSYRLQQAFEFIRVGASGVVNFFIEGWNTVIGLGFKVIDAYIFVAEKIVGIYNAIPGAPDIDIDAIRRIRDEAQAALTVTTRLDTTRRTIAPPPPKEQGQPALAQSTAAGAAPPTGFFSRQDTPRTGLSTSPVPSSAALAGSDTPRTDLSTSPAPRLRPTGFFSRQDTPRTDLSTSPVPSSAALAGSGALQVAPAIRELQAAIAELRDSIRDQAGGGQNFRVDQQLTFVGSQVGEDFVSDKIDEAFADLADRVRSQA